MTNDDRRKLSTSPFWGYYLFLLATQYFPDASEEHQILAAEAARESKDPLGTFRKAYLMDLIDQLA